MAPAVAAPDRRSGRFTTGTASVIVRGYAKCTPGSKEVWFWYERMVLKLDGYFFMDILGLLNQGHNICLQMALRVVVISMTLNNGSIRYITT